MSDTTRPQNDPSPDKAHDDWEQNLRRQITDHFTLARQRVDSVYHAHFGSVRTVLNRHWQHKQDIPRDLASLPRTTWRLLRQLSGRRNQAPQPTSLSRKERAVAHILIHELLALHELEQKIFNHVQRHPSASPQQWQELQNLLNGYTPEKAGQRLKLALNRLTVTQEGGRDIVMFLSLGIATRSLNDKIAFGSAMALGSSTATAWYLSNQSFLGAVWAKWFGVPGWITVAGSMGGFLIMLLATPLIAPLTEYSVNRIKAKKFLLQVIDQVEHQVFLSRSDTTSIAAQAGSYIQLLPDLLQALRGLK